MNRSIRFLRGSMKLWALAAAVIGVMIAVRGDRDPASAVTTETGPSLASTCSNGCAPAWVGNVSLLKGGHRIASTSLGTAMTTSGPSTINVASGDGGLFPGNSSFKVRVGTEVVLISSRSGDTLTIGARAQDGTTAQSHNVGQSVVLQPPVCPATYDPATACLYIWAKNVDATSSGATGFQIEATYDSRIVHALSITGMTTWLQSTGRGASCVAPAEGAISEDTVTGYGHATLTCVTLGGVPPAGPNCPAHCNGLMGLMQIESATTAQPSTSAFAINLSNGELGGTFLTDGTCSTNACGNPLASVIHSMTARIVKCANLVSDTQNMVLVSDIVYMVNRYRTHEADYDVNGNPAPGTPASPNWDARADLDGNHTLLVSDITIAVNQYRAICIP